MVFGWVVVIGPICRAVVFLFCVSGGHSGGESCESDSGYSCREFEWNLRLLL